MSAAFQSGTSSTTDLLPPLRRRVIGLFPRDRPEVRKVLIPSVALLIFVIMAVVIGEATKGRTRKQADVDTGHPIMARLATAKLDLDLLNSSALKDQGSSGPGHHGPTFGNRNRSNTLRLGDDYEELEKV